MRLPSVMIWFAALVAATILYLRQETGITVTGFAAEIRYSVASESMGRLKSLEVSLQQPVRRGQIVAALDDEVLRLELREARLELERLKLELGREEALWELGAIGQQTDQQTNLRRFARDVENAHIEYLLGLASLAEDRIRLQGLELILNRNRALEEDQWIPRADLDDNRIAFEALGERIEKQEPLVDEMRTRYLETDKRFNRFMEECLAQIPGSEPILKPLEYAVKVQEVRMEQINLAIVKLALRAPADGRIDEIFRRSGEVVAMGEPVVSIVETRSSEIVAFLPETRILEIGPGSQVRIKRIANPSQVYESSVASVDSSIRQLPVRTNPGFTVPSWGLAVHIPLPNSVEAKPGEAFEVVF